MYHPTTVRLRLRWLVGADVRETIMNGPIIDHIDKLCTLFEARCVETGTLSEIRKRIVDRNSWKGCYDLFLRIRSKHRKTQRNTAEDAQYAFEEICAKTIYNLGGFSPPFDTDSPYWIIPLALTLAQSLKIDERLITQIIIPNQSA